MSLLNRDLIITHNLIMSSNKCIGFAEYKCDDATTKCNDCKVLLCEKCIVFKWNTCNDCAKAHRQREVDYLVENNIRPSYQWHHTQNDDGKRYEADEWTKITSNSFKTLSECIDNIREFQKYLEDGSESKSKITYIISHWVNTKYHEDGSISSGIVVSEKIYKPDQLNIGAIITEN